MSFMSDFPPPITPDPTAHQSISSEPRPFIELDKALCPSVPARLHNSKLTTKDVLEQITIANNQENNNQKGKRISTSLLICLVISVALCGHYGILSKPIAALFSVGVITSLIAAVVFKSREHKAKDTKETYSLVIIKDALKQMSSGQLDQVKNDIKGYNLEKLEEEINHQKERNKDASLHKNSEEWAQEAANFFANSNFDLNQVMLNLEKLTEKGHLRVSDKIFQTIFNAIDERITTLSNTKKNASNDEEQAAMQTDIDKLEREKALLIQAPSKKDAGWRKNPQELAEEAANFFANPNFDLNQLDRKLKQLTQYSRLTVLSYEILNTLLNDIARKINNLEKGDKSPASKTNIQKLESVKDKVIHELHRQKDLKNAMFQADMTKL